MDDNNDEDICEAFTQIFTMIKNLQIIENSAIYQNNSALEKCKSEIEALLGEEEGEWITHKWYTLRSNSGE